jgi:RNA polymerase sigma factor (sigma-70 family)
VQKSNDELLLQAREREDWNTLWTAAVPIVKGVVDRLLWLGEVVNFEKDELIAEGNLAAGFAVRSWWPLDGQFSTHITNKIRWHLLTFVVQAAKHTRGRVDVEIEQLASDEDADPHREIVAKRIQENVHLLSNGERRLLDLYFGLSDNEPLGYREIAVAHDVSHMTVQRALQRVLRKLSA